MHGHVTVHHCNDAVMHGRPLTRSSFDNDKCHVTAFRPISEAAHTTTEYDAHNMAQNTD